MLIKSYFHIGGWFFRLAGLWIACGLAITSSVSTPVWAQSTEDTWAAPLNISQSGAATNPAIFVDSGSVMHVVWQDALQNFVETRFDDGEWSVPQMTGLHILFGLAGSQSAPGGTDTEPFTGPNPLFVASDRSYIFAFWLTAEGKLYVSRVLNTEFANAASWTSRKLISDSTAAFAAAVDARGTMHLTFLRTAVTRGRATGIYYASLKRFGQNWSTPTLLYESAYFGGLAGSKANLSLATAGTADAPLVYVAWDNQPRKQVLLAKSSDGGENWEETAQVAGPTPNASSAIPFNIRVGAMDNSVVLIWQRGQPGGACTQFNQSSGDAGASWSEAKLMSQELPSCATLNEFVVGQPASAKGLLYLMTSTKSEVFLSAWDGSQWSQPQLQPLLTGFQDPELFTQVDFGCYRTAWLEERLNIIGCDEGEGGDIWVTSRDVKAEAAAWFTPPVWSQAAPITSENFEVTEAVSVATADNLVHVFFSQRQDTAIYYTRWDGTSWSRITAVLTVPEGQADWPAVAAGPTDELFLIAHSSSGSLYFSRANSAEAVTPSAWATPARIQLAQPGSASPADIEWNKAGTITVAYSIPVNDDRGVYVVQSSDVGKSWSNPIQVVDGAGANFELVGSPSLLESINGDLHVMWQKQSVGVDSFIDSLALYYARSEDAGKTFTTAELVVEAPVTWRDLAADGKGNLHRIWQQPNLKSTLWDQVSIDGGRTWQSTQRLSAEEGTAVVVRDGLGQLHLLGVGMGSLGEWLWDNSRWQTDTGASWLSAALHDVPAAELTAAVNAKGNLVVVLAAPTGAGDGTERLMFYATRTLDLPAGSNPLRHKVTRRLFPAWR